MIIEKLWQFTVIVVHTFEYVDSADFRFDLNNGTPRAEERKPPWPGIVAGSNGCPWFYFHLPMHQVHAAILRVLYTSEYLLLMEY